MVRMNTVTSLLAKLPQPLLGALLAALALVEAFLLLMTYLVLRDLLATGADAEEKRAWNNLTWDMGVGFVAISVIGALIVVVLVRAWMHKSQLRIL
jgi:hypothetical protein